MASGHEGRRSGGGGGGCGDAGSASASGRSASDLVPEDPGDGGDGGDVVLVADAVRQELVPDLPGEHPGVLHLEVLDEVDHLGRGHPGLAAPDGSGQDGARLVVPGQDLGDAAVGHPELPGDVAGSDAQLGQLDDPDPDVVGQGPAVDKHPSQLVDLSILIQLRIWKQTR